MSYFIELFGGITLGTVVVFLAAVVFLIAVGRKIYKFIVNDHDARQEKEDTLTKVVECLKEVKKEQLELKDAICSLKLFQQDIAARQDEIEEQNRVRNMNDLRDKLLKNYRYYTSVNKNPMKAWSEMEQESFDSLFKDYEDLGGNGFMHSTVAPAMAMLEVIPMTEYDRLAEMMSQRVG